MFGAFTQGVDFKCNATICFGVGAVHDQFKTLQATINRFAPLGITPLVVDGFIGDKTVVAAKLAADMASAAPPGNTREAVAANALTLTAQLQIALSQLEAEGILTPTVPSTPTVPEAPTAITPAVAIAIQQARPPEITAVVQQAVAACRASRSSPTCTRAKQLCKTVKGTPQAKLAEVGEICDATRVPTWVWLLAGAGAVAAVTVGVLARRRRRQREFAELGHSDDWREGRRPGAGRRR